MIPLQFLLIVLHARLDRVRRDERGASAVEWVIITAILAVIAVALAALIQGLVEDKSSTINLNE